MGIRVPAPWGLVTLPETLLVVKEGFAKERGPLQQVFITTTTMIEEPLLEESGNQWPCRHLPGLPEFSLLSQTSVWKIPERKKLSSKIQAEDKDYLGNLTIPSPGLVGQLPARVFANHRVGCEQKQSQAAPRRGKVAVLTTF